MIEGWLYILSNKNRTVLYIGATKNLKKRIELHIEGKATEFTRKYNVNDAFKREKQLKNWKKDWKWNLIKSQNFQLKKVYLEL